MFYAFYAYTELMKLMHIAGNDLNEKKEKTLRRDHVRLDIHYRIKNSV